MIKQFQDQQLTSGNFLSSGVTYKADFHIILDLPTVVLKHVLSPSGHVTFTPQESVGDMQE